MQLLLLLHLAKLKSTNRDEDSRHSYLLHSSFPSAASFMIHDSTPYPLTSSPLNGHRLSAQDHSFESSMRGPPRLVLDQESKVVGGFWDGIREGLWRMTEAEALERDGLLGLSFRNGRWGKGIFPCCSEQAGSLEESGGRLPNGPLIDPFRSDDTHVWEGIIGRIKGTLKWNENIEEIIWGNVG